MELFLVKVAITVIIIIITIIIIIIIIIICLNQVADLVLGTRLSLIFFYSGVLMVWSILFYFCRLFFIFLFSFHLYYFSLLLMASLLVYIT